jgi:hypothetical protein
LRGKIQHPSWDEIVYMKQLLYLTNMCKQETGEGVGVDFEGVRSDGEDDKAG